jgi:hypothetical protein
LYNIIRNTLTLKIMKTNLIIKVSKNHEMVYDFSIVYSSFTKVEYDLFVKKTEKSAKKHFPNAKITWSDGPSKQKNSLVHIVSLG